MNARRILLGIAIATTLTVAPACAQQSGAASGATAAPAPDAANATYTIEKTTVTLANGRSERPSAPGSASGAVTTIDRTSSADVDGDGRADSIVILVNQTGGSGTFYYVAALLNPSGGVLVTPALLLGDRVKISGVRADAGTIIVELLDRASGQPFTASPSIASTKRFGVDHGILVLR